jgi:hypothetical protein
MRDKNGQGEDNGTGPSDHAESSTIRVAEDVRDGAVQDFSTGAEMLVQKSNQQRPKKET